jgi:hypothetical protein
MEVKMRGIWFRLAANLALLLSLTSATALPQTPHVEFPPGGGIVTLYAYDAQFATLSFLDGKSGMVMKDHAIYNRDSHLAFEIYDKDSLRVGIQGRQSGTIVDLGSADDLEARYSYGETVGKSQGFASIHRESGKLVILKDRRKGEFQPLKEAALLLGKAEGGASAPVVLGHIYLVRIADREAEIVTAKLRVLAFTPGQSVTILWERL